MSAALAIADPDCEPLKTRADIINRKRSLRDVGEALTAEWKDHRQDSPAKSQLHKAIQANYEEGEELELALERDFLPQHSPGQLISPRAFFVSSLFRVCSKRLVREVQRTLSMTNSLGQVVFKYTGPELRQSDGMVFMALLNLVRDVRAGEPVSFYADDLCRAVFGRYDGPSRKSLKEHIKRLQRGLMEFDKFSVQLCLRFDHPEKGPWQVMLDKDIVQLFRKSTHVWLDLSKRQELPEGLTTWLYGFVESQTRLIPTSVCALRDLCGSDANEESFPKTLRLALKELNSHGLIDPGWHITRGVVYWRKPLDQNGQLGLQTDDSVYTLAPSPAVPY